MQMNSIVKQVKIQGQGINFDIFNMMCKLNELYELMQDTYANANKAYQAFIDSDECDYSIEGERYMFECVTYLNDLYEDMASVKRKIERLDTIRDSIKDIIH